MIKKILVSAILFGFVLGSLSALEGTYGPSSSEDRILLAYEDTRFKTRIMNELLELLDDGDTFIRVVDHQNGGLDGQEASDYDAVYITNSGATAKVRPWVINWLRDNGTDPENVIVHTTQINEWTPRVQVDSVTSASYNSANDISSLARDLSAQIRAKYQ